MVSSSWWDALLKPGRADDFFADRPREAFAPTAGDRLVDAWWCAELSRLAYRDVDRASFLATTPLCEVAFHDERSSQVLVVAPRAVSAPPFTIVVFRGTDELRDWAANVRAMPVRWAPGGHVHRGFRRSLAKVWLPLRRTLRDLDRARGAAAPLFIAGHSLGGAMALLAGSVLRARAVHTFGAPRTGDEEFARAFAGIAVCRFAHGHDIVPRLRILGLVHVGEGRHLDAPSADQEGQDEVVPPARDDRSWLDPTPLLADHAPLAYVRALRRLLPDPDPGPDPDLGPVAAP